MKKSRTIKVLSVLVALTAAGCIFYWGFYARIYNQENTKQDTSIGIDTDRTVGELVDDMLAFPDRYAGSKGNAAAVQYIRNYFREAGLEPYYEDTYYQSFYSDYLKLSRFYMLPAPGTVENIIGKIKGIDSTRAVIVSAHMDSYFSKGALDNASGTAVLLKIAERLSQVFQPGEYPVDLIFAAYNLEEGGMIGSEAFYPELASSYTDFYNINLDCVGATDRALAVKNDYADSEALYQAFLPFLDKHEIPCKDVVYTADEDGIATGSSDHEVFQENGRAAIILGEADITGIVHSEADNDTRYLDFAEMDRLTDAVVDFVTATDGTIY